MRILPRTSWFMKPVTHGEWRTNIYRVDIYWHTAASVKKDRRVSIIARTRFVTTRNVVSFLQLIFWIAIWRGWHRFVVYFSFPWNRQARSIRMSTTWTEFVRIDGQIFKGVIPWLLLGWVHFDIKELLIIMLILSDWQSRCVEKRFIHSWNWFHLR